MFPGFNTVGFFNREKAGITLVDTFSSVSVNGDSLSVDGVNFGNISWGGSKRYLIAVITTSDNDVADDVEAMSVTIGGEPTTQVNFSSDAGDSNTGAVLIAIAEVPNGTSGNVTVTISNFNGTMDAYGFALYRAINLASITPTTTPTGSSNLTLVVPPNGFGVVGAVPTTDTQNIGEFTGSGAITAYSGSRAGAAMHRIVPGSVVHDASRAERFAGATWQFK